MRRHAAGADGGRAGGPACGRAAALFAAAGITWVQEAAATPTTWRPTYALRPTTSPCAPTSRCVPSPASGRDQRAAVRRGPERAVDSAGTVSARTVKFFADGIVEAGTAAMLEPYDDEPHSCGLPVWAPAELAAAVAAVDAAGFQLHIHAIGDAGVRAALDAFAHAAAVNGPRDRRPVIAHTQVVDPADLPRFADLGVVANFEPLWALPRPGTARTGAAAARGAAGLHYAIASVLASGAVMSIGSDWPVSLAAVRWRGSRSR